MFLFISELFRGDEAMYERSIKTINSFTIWPEAEYWIKRELKTKLGWTDSNHTVQQFDQLIRRRFSWINRVIFFDAPAFEYTYFLAAALFSFSSTSSFHISVSIFSSSSALLKSSCGWVRKIVKGEVATLNGIRAWGRENLPDEVGGGDTKELVEWKPSGAD